GPLGGRAGVLPDDRGMGGAASRINGDEGGPVPVDPDRADVADVQPGQLAHREADRAPPGLRILLGAAGRRIGVGRVAGPGEPQEPPIEPNEPRLDLGRPEIDREDRGFATHAAAPESSKASTASAVGWSVTSVVSIPPRSAPRIGRTLPSPLATPIRTGTRPSSRASNAIVRSRSASQTNRPSRSNGLTSTSPTAPDRVRSSAMSGPRAAALQAGPPMPKAATSRRSQRSAMRRTPAWATSDRLVTGSSTRPGASRPIGSPPMPSATRRNGSRAGPVNQ